MGEVFVGYIVKEMERLAELIITLQNKNAQGNKDDIIKATKEAYIVLAKSIKGVETK